MSSIVPFTILAKSRMRVIRKALSILCKKLSLDSVFLSFAALFSKKTLFADHQTCFNCSWNVITWFSNNASHCNKTKDYVRVKFLNWGYALNTISKMIFLDLILKYVISTWLQKSWCKRSLNFLLSNWKDVQLYHFRWYS